MWSREYITKGISSKSCLENERPEWVDNLQTTNLVNLVPYKTFNYCELWFNLPCQIKRDCTSHNQLDNIMFSRKKGVNI